MSICTDWALTVDGERHDFDPVKVSGWTIGGREYRTDDTDRPRTDGRYFGQDFMSPGNIEIDLLIRAKEVTEVVETREEVARNYAPKIVGSGNWAEVRRNYVPQPNFVVNSSWGANTATKQLMSDSTGTFLRVTRVGTTGDPNVNMSIPLPPVGDRNIRLMVRGNGVTRSQGSTLLQEAGPTYNALSATALPHGTAVPAEWTEYVGADAALASTVTNARILLRPGQGDGEYLDYKFVYVGGAGGYFDGSTMDNSMTQPEDFRVRWLGTPNASASVMEIERVAGLLGANAVAGLSSRGGRPALRLIPSGSSFDTSAQFIAPAALRPLGSVLAGSYEIDAPLTGALSSFRLRLRAGEPQVASPVAESPNTAGPARSLRLAVPPTTIGHWVRWYHGGARGSGDVWWTGLGLFDADYDGDWFDGDTQTTEEYAYYWDGNVAVKERRIYTSVVTRTKLENAWDIKQAFNRIWDGDKVRFTPGKTAELDFGGLGKAEGRPRHVDWDESLIKAGIIKGKAMFVRADEQSYYSSDDGSTGDFNEIEVGIVPPEVGGLVAPLRAPLTTTRQSTRARPFFVDGGQETWPMIIVKGPISAGARVELVNGWTLVVNRALAWDEEAVFDSRPGKRTMRLNGRTMNLLRPSGTRLSKLSLPPGWNEVALRGTSLEGTASVTIRWWTGRNIV